MRKAKRILIVRDFRANFQRLTEPVQVIRSRGRVEVLGTWYPAERGADSTIVRYPAEQPDAALAGPERSGKGT